MSGQPLTARNYDASGGRSAVLELAGRDAVQIENQRDAFALCWETELGREEFESKLRELMPDIDFPSPELHQRDGQVRHAEYQLEDMAIFWHAESRWNRERSAIDVGVREETMDLETIRRLIETTAAPELREHQDRVLAETQELVGSRLRR
jgi:hypothetical protein